MLLSKETCSILSPSSSPEQIDFPAAALRMTWCYCYHNHRPVLSPPFVLLLLLLLGAIATTIISQFGLLRWENCRRPLITLLVTLQLTHTWFSPLQLFFCQKNMFCHRLSGNRKRFEWLQYKLDRTKVCQPSAFYVLCILCIQCVFYCADMLQTSSFQHLFRYRAPLHII